MFPRGPSHARSLVRKLELHKLPLRSARGNATSSSGGSQGGPAKSAAGGLLNAALTSGTFGLASDTMVQLFEQHASKKEGSSAKAYDPLRAGRMLGYGLIFYGPLQHYWYGLLDRTFHRRTYLPHFVSKVALNQLVLGPIVLMSVFAWNLGLQGKMKEVGEKVKKDLVPSLFNAWKFWVPAASANFYLIPLQRQVLFMSACSIGWTGYLSFESNRKAGAHAKKTTKSV